jgi:hypothetical protein
MVKSVLMGEKEHSIQGEISMSDSGEGIMGDIAEMILDGILCEICGSFIDLDAPMHPRECEDCKKK